MRNHTWQGYRELIDALREPAVRDLAWLLLSADMLSAARFPAALAHTDAAQALIDGATAPAPPPAFEALRTWLLAQDADPAPLLAFLDNGESGRLGRYAERLLHFHLAANPDFELLAAGLQVRDARRGNMTLGECDFLLRRQIDAELLHWELAVKLYLYVPPGTADEADVNDPIHRSPHDERARQFHWLGPNLADSLADKIERLVEHQLRLTTLPAARSALPDEGPWTPQVYLKGWLFHPLHVEANVPDMVAPSHGRGWWATLDEWWAQVHALGAGQPKDAFDLASQKAWALLPRARWLAPARVTEDAVLSVDGMRARIERHWHERGVSEPLLIVALERTSHVDAQGVPVWVERARGFVVADYWAPRARHRLVELAQRNEAARQAHAAALSNANTDDAPSL